VLALTAGESTRYCTYGVMTVVPVPGSQNVIRLFLLPGQHTSRSIIGCHSIYLMSHRLPVRIRSSRHSMKDQTCEVESSLTGKSSVVRREAIHVWILDVQTMQ
jgi:hypothetical protein